MVLHNPWVSYHKKECVSRVPGDFGENIRPFQTVAGRCPETNGGLPCGKLAARGYDEFLFRLPHSKNSPKAFGGLCRAFGEFSYSPSIGSSVPKTRYLAFANS